ncbi:MAG: general secretion pathway protein GspK [Planctomycetes bacterium]|nr:general secretion pathway protein GspK [Planctomycetota bacterium]
MDAMKMRAKAGVSRRASSSSRVACSPALGGARTFRRSAVVLITVLLMLVLLGLMAAGFAFHVYADAGGARAVMDRLQTRLAAEAGIQRATLMLRTQRLDVNAWYDNEEEFRHVLVWTPGGDRTLIGTTAEPDELSSPKAYRFSLVADDPFDDEVEIRYGIIDEAAKLNINIATEEELVALFQQFIDENMVTDDQEEINVGQLAKSVIYWRSSQPDLNESERQYYAELDPPYRIKHAPFETVEELLLVRGFNGLILYGEDQDRNGLLSINEDDGDESFPMDNGDNLLNPGIYPYLTVWSRDLNTASDNRARVYAVADNEKAVRERLEEFIDDDQVISYILQAIKKQTDDGESGPETEGGGRTPGGNEGGGRRTGDEPSIMGGRPGVTSIGGGRRRTGERPGRGGGSKSDEGNRRTAGQTEDAEASDVATLPADGKIARMLQTAVVDDPRSADPESPADGIDSPDKTGRDDQGIKDAGSTGEAAPGEDQVRDQDKTGTEQGAGMTTPASLLRGEDGQVGTSPVDYDHLPILLDHLTFIDPTSPELPGLIDVNTAPGPVLRTLAALSEEQIQDIIDTRLELESERKITPAWLITDAGIDLETFEQIAGRICARGNRFTIESLGYSDHRGMMTRLQVVVEMRGPVAQVMYYRDNTHLGTNFPIWYEDGDSTRAERTR